MIEPRADRAGRLTLGADKGYDNRGLRQRAALHERDTACGGKGRRLAIDRCTTRNAGYATSQRIRKRIEEAFGWSKTIGLAPRTMLRGIERVGARFTFTLAGYDLARLPKLLAA